MEKPKQEDIISIPEEDIQRWIDEQYPDSGMAESVKGYFRNILNKEFFYLAKDRSANWYVYVNQPRVGFSAWSIDTNKDAYLWAQVSMSLGDVFDSRLGPDHDWQQLFRVLPASRKVVIHEEFEL